MSGGPISPFSTYPADASGRTFPNPFSGGGAGSNNPTFTEGLGVAASIAADVAWQLWFAMPPAIPSGTMKLYLRGLAAATSGVAKITPYSVSISPTGYPSAAPGFAESQQTLTWVADGSTNWSASAVTVGASGGTGYAVGDQITCAGGTFSQAAILRVSTVTATAVTGLTVVQQGVYSVKPVAGAVTQGSTTGSGSGALATLTFDSAGSNGKLLEAKVSLTPPPVVDGIYGINLVFNTTSWTLAAVSTWLPTILWE